MIETRERNSSGTAKTALGFGIGGAALALLNGGAGILPGVRPVGTDCGFVTDKEINLVRENSGKDALIAQLQAERYADTAIKLETEPLKTRICALETAAAVNAARDADYRRYVEREFVHQPKAKMCNSIVTTQSCGCDCCNSAES